MAYTKQTWANGSGGNTPISAARLQYIEDGIAAAANPLWSDISGKPSTFSPAAHSHPVTDVTGLDSILSGKAAKPTGTPDGTKFYRDDGVWAAVTATGGGSLTPFVINVGTGAAGPYSVAHNLNTQNFIYLIRRNPGHPANRPLADPGEYITAQVVPNGPNSAYIKPDETWAVDQFQLVLVPLGGDDTSKPGTPVISFVSKTSSTVTVSATSTDNVGATFYQWYADGAYAGMTDVNSFTFGTYGQSTPHAFTCYAFDLQANKSLISNVLNVTTDVGLPPAFDASGSQGSGVGNPSGGQSSWTITQNITIGAGNNRILLVHLAVNGNGGTVPEANATITVTTSNGNLPLFKLKGIDAGDGASATTGIGQVWYLLNPNVGLHTITANVNTGSTWVGGLRLAATSYANVSGITLKGFRTSIGASALLNASVSSSVDNVVGITIFMDNAAPVGFNQTTRTGGGANASGQADFVSVGDAPGAATVNFTTTAAQQHGWIAYELTKV